MKVVLLDSARKTYRTLTADTEGIRANTSWGSTSASASTLDEITALLGEFAPPDPSLIPVVHGNPQPVRHSDALLLIALSARWPTLTATTDPHTFRQHHLTLAHALPLALDSQWRAWAADHADSLIRSQQLVMVPASALVAVKPDNNEIWHRQRRLLRHHARTEVVRHYGYARFLDQWSTFSARRFGRPLPVDERTALHALLDMSGCEVREFIQGDETIAHSVVCLHGACRIVFDMMVAWHPRHARLRPGIFSAIHNLTDAFRRGWSFSLCYGQFPYKDQILGPAHRLTLENLLDKKDQ